jgi:hypothetical protein
LAAHSFISSRAAVIHELTEDHLVLTWERCVGVVWKRETTIAGMAKVEAVFKEQLTRYQTGLYLLTVIEEGASLPPAEAREAVAIFLRTAAGKIRMSAVVHEGSGFRAAAVRSVVTGLSMLVRLPYPHEIFATVEQAAKWLGSTQFKDVDADYTVLAVSHARRSAESLQPKFKGR